MRQALADPFDVEFTEFGLKQFKNLLVEVGRKCRPNRRYLGDAWAQRKKVFKTCCALNQDETLNSRNELNGVGGVDT